MEYMDCSCQLKSAGTQLWRQETQNSWDSNKGYSLQELASFWLSQGVLISVICDNLRRLGQKIFEPSGTYTLPPLLWKDKDAILSSASLPLWVHYIWWPHPWNNKQSITVNIWKSYNYVNCGLRNEHESNLCSNELYLSSSENRAWK